MPAATQRDDRGADTDRLDDVVAPLTAAAALLLVHLQRDVAKHDLLGAEAGAA